MGVNPRYRGERVDNAYQVCPVPVGALLQEHLGGCDVIIEDCVMEGCVVSLVQRTVYRVLARLDKHVDQVCVFELQSSVNVLAERPLLKRFRGILSLQG